MTVRNRPLTKKEREARQRARDRAADAMHLAGRRRVNITVGNGS